MQRQKKVKRKSFYTLSDLEMEPSPPDSTAKAPFPVWVALSQELRRSSWNPALALAKVYKNGDVGLEKYNRMCFFTQ